MHSSVEDRRVAVFDVEFGLDGVGEEVIVWVRLLIMA